MEKFENAMECIGQAVFEMYENNTPEEVNTLLTNVSVVVVALSDVVVVPSLHVLVVLTSVTTERVYGVVTFVVVSRAIVCLPLASLAL